MLFAPENGDNSQTETGFRLDLLEDGSQLPQPLRTRRFVELRLAHRDIQLHFFEGPHRAWII